MSEITTEVIPHPQQTVAHVYVDDITVSVARSVVDGRLMVEIDGDLPVGALCVALNDNYIYGGPA